MIRKILAVATAAVRWLAVPENRGSTYRSARVVIPLLVLAGFLTSGQAAHVLAVLAVVAGFAVPHLAARHTPKRSRGQTGAARPGLLTVVACVLAGGFFGSVASAHARDIPPPPRTHWMATPCAEEDSLNCFWNADVQGNGSGHSFYSVKRDGIRCIYYVDQTFASNNDDCH